MTLIDAPDRWSTARLVVALCAVAVATFFAMGQAITFAWLSALPEQASRLDSLAWRFWVFAALSLILVVIDLWLAVMILRRVLRRRSRRDNAKALTPGRHA
jgi:hypothetical protein